VCQPRAVWFRALDLCIQQFAEGSLSRFASLLQKRKSTVWGWHRGGLQMCLDAVLQTCWVTGVSAVNFLTGELYNISKKVGNVRQICLTEMPKPQRPKRYFDQDKVQARLEAALKDEPPQSLRQVSVVMQYDRRFLRKHFGRICSKISARYRKYRRAIVEREKNEFREEMRQAAFTLYNKGIYPSRRRVAAMLKRAGRIDRKEAQSLLRSIHLELGLR
jgi:hypothetical protein